MEENISKVHVLGREEGTVLGGQEVIENWFCFVFFFHSGLNKEVS